ncbi:MAG: NAD(P)/FAD-dependent oxidoreductase [Clostridia bacterium]|nr:NAD(P)/FAD-dependent oxidoreductase [Clostridia bacterium]
MNDRRPVGNTNTVLVIGGGAAGMMAAITAAQHGASVTVFEPNRMLGRKLRITGKGRCNVTNDCSPAEVLENVTKNARFLTGAMYRCTPADVMAFFEERGVPLKTERGRRVFPVSDKAADISRALEKEMELLGVRVVQELVTSLMLSEEGCVGVSTKEGDFPADAVIVATGGASYPGTGSRGDGYSFARQAGMKVSPPMPSLIPIVTEEDTSPLSGLSLKNVTLHVSHKGKEVFSEMGEMLFTHFGVSGPLVLSASAHMRAPVPEYEMTIDLKPALDDATLDARLVSDLKKFAQRDFINALSDLLPQKLIEPVVAVSGIDPRKKAGAVTRQERRTLGFTLKHFPLTPLRFRPIDEAIITSGGVEVSGIHTKTMMSKTVPGLFFAGEVIDVDAYTGGYNLQIAFATGAAAGQSAAEYAAAPERKD